MFRDDAAPLPDELSDRAGQVLARKLPRVGDGDRPYGGLQQFNLIRHPVPKGDGLFTHRLPSERLQRQIACRETLFGAYQAPGMRGHARTARSTYCRNSGTGPRERAAAFRRDLPARSKPSIAKDIAP